MTAQYVIWRHRCSTATSLFYATFMMESLCTTGKHGCIISIPNVVLHKTRTDAVLTATLQHLHYPQKS